MFKSSSRHFLALALLATVSVALASACTHGAIGHRRPQNASEDRAITKLWASEIAQVAQSGDIILTRSYSKTGDAIVGVTGGKSFSHAAVYDAERNTIIEAVRPGVRERRLEHLLSRNHRAVVVRPLGGPEEGAKALARARGALGKSFDYAGLIGIDNESRFYCSELVSWSWGIDSGVVITPAELYEEGELIYLSGERDENQVRRVAVARARERRRVAQASIQVVN